MFARDRPPKVRGNLHILHIGPASANCTVPIRHGRNIGPTWGQLWPARPQLAPTWLRLQLWPNLAPTWCNLAISWTHFEATSAKSRGPSWAQPGPILRTQCETLKTYIFTIFTAISILVGDSCVRAHVAHIGPVSGPTRGQMPPHRTKLRPSSGQVGPKLKPTGRNLRPLLLRSTKGQGRPSLTPVGFWLGQVGPLLSSLFYSLGAGGSRREATRRTSSAERLANIIKYPHLYPLM
jgi:hypothetical protein